MTRLIIQGIKYDDKSSFQKGAKLAPSLIREALYEGSYNLCAENGKTIENSFKDGGDFEVTDYFEIENITAKNLNGFKKILTLGGDHSVTYPIIKAINFKYPKIDILHIDAHPDLYHEYEGDPYSHACPFARIMEGGLADKLVQVGIRTMTNHLKQQAKKFGVEIHEMKSLDLRNLPEFKNPLYISIDLDGIDPAFAPGVSHHEPGGLSVRQVIDIIQNINTEVIGADIVEYNPNRDFMKMTAYVAAKLMKELIAKMDVEVNKCCLVKRIQLKFQGN